MWALDLGTTNSLLARWDRDADRPRLLELPGICRPQGLHEAGVASLGVPSAVEVVERPSLWARRFGFGRLAHIGQQALERNRVLPRQSFVRSFKRELSRSPLAAVARAGGRSYTAREVARLFLRELCAEVKAASGERLRDLVVTAPVEAFETYRAEISAAARAVGIRRVRFLDEPVAAALGYGLGLGQERRVMVVDFGGGTFHIALLRLRAQTAAEGRGEVVAKAGRDIGGNLVDRWVLEDVCRRAGVRLMEDLREMDRVWSQLMLSEACRVKEAVYFEEQAHFGILPPGRHQPMQPKEDAAVPFGRAELSRILGERGLFGAMGDCLGEVLSAAQALGLREGEVDEVLMVGGSTLLPGVFAFFEERFGRDRVRAWQPFEAVAYGACVFAAGRVEPSDFIVHDYALLTYDLRTKEPQYTVIVPRGTRFPTPPNLWRQELVPTCALGEPERVFKLVVCEIGQPDGERCYGWDGGGQLHRLGAQGPPLVVKLNEVNPAIGRLEPPHSPSDRSSRIDLSFGVNPDRWLCATALDLRTRKYLMRDEPVVRLL